MNRCDICGKFRKWDELHAKGSIDYMGNEDDWYECLKCSLEEFTNAAIQPTLSTDCK